VGSINLVYAMRIGQDLMVSACGRTRPIEDSDEDLPFLKDFNHGKVATRITGRVRFMPDEEEDSEQDLTPLKDVRVAAKTDRVRLETTTDSTGTFTFLAPPNGTYSIDPELPGYHLVDEPGDLDLRAHGCVVADLLMKVDRRVQGVIRDKRGDPVAGVMVELVSVSRAVGRPPPVLLAISDDDGKYAIDGIPPGEYHLGINIRSAPTKQFPYPASYYPGTTDVRQAVPISIGEGSAFQEFELTVADKLPIVKLRARILKDNGKPPELSQQPAVRFKEPGLAGQIEQETIVIDSDGRFVFELCSGVKYSAFAFAGSPNATQYSAPVEFVPSEKDDTLELVLNKTAAEFAALSKRMRNGRK
jgi:hypothetical protein